MIEHDEFGILNRLILNVRIDPSPEGVLRILGFVHLYTASGLHLISLESFFRRIFVRNLSDQRKMMLGFWLFLILIWKLQSFRLGFARILILFLIRAWAREKGYRWRVFYPLFIAFCFDFALGIEAGWSHYYLAVLGGLIGLERSREDSIFRQHLSLSVCSWLMTAPLDLWNHQIISWITPFWSMITIPVISWVLYPLSLAAYLLLGTIPEPLVMIWNRWIQGLLALVDQGLTFQVADSSNLRNSLVISTLLGLLFMIFRHKRERILLMVSAILILMLLSKPQGVRVLQLKVGQGDSMLVQKKGVTELVDVGSSRSLKPESMILKMAQHGVSHVDTLLLTHLDEDHVGGIRFLFPWVNIHSVEFHPGFSRAKKIGSWISLNPRIRICQNTCFQSGVVDWIWDTHGAGKGNSLMGTVVIPLDSKTIYLNLGDAGHYQEHLFWNRHHSWIMSYPDRVLKVSHHGSRHSSSEEWLQKLNPSLAVVSVGEKNRYGHPHPEVMERLRRSGIRIHRTDRDSDFILLR